jgi:hypothetical protein
LKADERREKETKGWSEEKRDEDLRRKRKGEEGKGYLRTD